MRTTATRTAEPPPYRAPTPAPDRVQPCGKDMGAAARLMPVLESWPKITRLSPELIAYHKHRAHRLRSPALRRALWRAYRQIVGAVLGWCPDSEVGKDRHTRARAAESKGR